MSQSPSAEQVRNVIIIGSGPAGYTAAVYAARANLHPLVFEGSVTAGGALDEHHRGGELPRLPRRHHGPGPDGRDARPGRAVRCRAGHRRRRSRSTSTGEIKTVSPTATDTYRARTVILATGSAYRELGLPDEKRLSGHGVSWCATCDGFFFRDQDIAVVGGGDSAIEEATFLTRFARNGHGRPPPRRAARVQDHAGAGVRRPQDPASSGTARWPPSRRRPRSPGSRCATPVDRRGERARRRPGCSSRSGTTPAPSCCTGQVELDDEGYVLVAHPSTATNLPGVFACGDLVDHHYRQAITAAGTGCAAALDAERYLAELDHAAASEDEARAAVIGSATSDSVKNAGL